MLAFRNSVKSLSRPVHQNGFKPIVRFFSSETIERDIIEADIIVVGGGPAGLSAAIRAKQFANDSGKELNVILVEKGAEIGSHILSGNVFEPRAFNELFPKWKKLPAGERPPLDTPVLDDQFFLLTKDNAYPVPHSLMPPEIHNEGNYIVSLSNLCKWMGAEAEKVGVEVYSGFAADKIVVEDGKLSAIQLKDSGVSKKGEMKDEYQPGPLLKAKQFIIAEGARGSITEQLVEAFGLEGQSPQSYSLGVKEVWKVPAHLHKEGLVVHTVGWPLTNDTYAGGFLYHAANQEIYLGVVVGLDYKNPYLSPYKELQALKTHPKLRPYFEHEESECVSYGGRVLQAGGLQSMHKPVFPGGMLAGCSLGTLNMPKIKGTHTAMKSGMLAGETAAKKLLSMTPEQLENVEGLQIDELEDRIKESWMYSELHQVRNVKPAFKKLGGGMLGMMSYAGAALHVTKGKEPWTFNWTSKDHEATEPASKHTPPAHYFIKPDGKVTFDLLENLSRSNVAHEEDQPSHLKVRPEKASVPLNESLRIYGGPEQHFCPAKVYEYVTKVDEKTGKAEPQLVINAQNCVHCKTCAIKTPKEFIKWTVPEGAGGPNYVDM